MEEDKAAAYYDELSRKGGGAARFKQGLGFSSSAASDGDPPPPSRGSALPTSSFLSNFVRASSPAQSSKFEKEAQLQSVQNKLKRKPSKEETFSARDSESSRGRESTSSSRRRSRSGERGRGRDGDRDSRRRSRSRSRERYRDRERRSRKRSRSRSRSPRKERRGRSRSFSPPRERRRSEKSRREEGSRNVAVDYSRMIEGYDKMTQAERVKARMKFQLSDTAEKDTTKGNSGWERFEFDQDAPLDDEEVEAAEDDTALVKHIGQSFRFSAVEARREERIKAAHDEAMFGARPPPLPVSVDSESEPQLEKTKETNKHDLSIGLLSEKVLAKQQGSWRDRAGKP